LLSPLVSVRLSIARTWPSAGRRSTWPRSFNSSWPGAFRCPWLAQHGRSLLAALHRLVRRWPRLTVAAVAAVAAAVTAVIATSVTAPSAPAQANGTLHHATQPARATLHHAVQPHAQKPASQPQHQSRPPAPAKPYYIYDSVTPKDIPAEHHTVATYINGRYKASQSDVTDRHKVLWIDTTGGNSSAAVLDVEPGDATPATAAHWAYQRLHHDPNAQCCIYTMRSMWPAVRAAVHQLPPSMGGHVQWWIADPTGHPHVVPGSDATQWYWGRTFDISTANPGF
jgi:hypothetical protein